MKLDGHSTNSNKVQNHYSNLKSEDNVDLDIDELAPIHEIIIINQKEEFYDTYNKSKYIRNVKLKRIK